MNLSTKPRVSVVIPVLNGMPYIKTAIHSMQNQTYKNIEIIVVNEYGSNDGTFECVSEMADKDERILIIQNTEELGMAESINKGIRYSSGQYIARMDADDYSYPERLMKQVKYLDENPKVGVLGTWQHHYGKRDWTHCPARMYDKCGAILLFDCNMCHSTVMIRKSVLYDNNVFYEDSNIEDFKLWNKLIKYTHIENIPEVLGEYLESDSNISNEKMEAINEESAQIAMNGIQSIFHIRLEADDALYFQMFKPAIDDKKYREDRLKEICISLFLRNKEVQFCNDAVMMHVLHYLWVRNHTGEILFNNKIQTYPTIHDIFFIDSDEPRAERKTKVGKYTYGSLLSQEGLESAGAFCSFAPGCKILFNHMLGCVTTHEFLFADTNCKPLSGIQKYSWEGINRKTVIGNDVWLGENVLICNGACIGNGVIAAAGSVITKDVPDYAVVAGNPARIIKYRFPEEQIKALNEIAWWDWPDEKIKEKYDEFLDIDLFIMQNKVAKKDDD